jgi:hypothetical protein
MLVFAITLGAPVGLSGVDGPIATAGLSLFVNDAAAQTEIGDDCAFGFNGCIATDNEGGDGGDATSRGGNGGLASLHEAITTSAASETSLSLSDSPTGDNHIEVTNIVEPTDQTVVILNAGIFGSTGNHMTNMGAPSQSINTGSNNGSANASGGDTISRGGNGGFGNNGDVSQDVPTVSTVVIPLLPLS